MVFCTFDAPLPVGNFVEFSFKAFTSYHSKILKFKNEKKLCHCKEDTSKVNAMSPTWHKRYFAFFFISPPAALLHVLLY